MKILVVGRSGQLAMSLAEAAASIPAYDVIFAGRPDIDLEIAGSAAAAVAGARPGLVINAAAYTAVDQAEDDLDRALRINADAAGEIAQAARTIGATLIHLSTDYVFDGASPGAYREDAPACPLNGYGASKLAGEHAVREAAGRHLIIRTSWVYSPFGHNFVKTMMALADERDELAVVDDQRGCPTSAPDLAGALLSIADRLDGREGLYHLAGTGETSWCGFARRIMSERERLGLKAAHVRPLASADWPTRAQRPANSVLDSTAFERDFGFRLPDWQHSLRATVERLARSRAA
ncbi:MAG TPA: dTDP-4-dehydrorhamnose reductase [Sphingomicrobium sp.]|nr:dTDP-4-dehydrorhamnose reductase [Sphingomicrobium sp.]